MNSLAITRRVERTGRRDHRAGGVCDHPASRGAWPFRLLRYGFLLTIMYPYMLLVIPVYLVMYTSWGYSAAILGSSYFWLAWPVQFFLFEQFFRTLPFEVIEAATIDGASEAADPLARGVAHGPSRWSRRLRSSPSC